MPSIYKQVSKLAGLTCFCLLGTLLSAQAVQLNSLFSDEAVLQAGVPMPIWGTGTEGEKVHVVLGGYFADSVVKDGKWKVTLDPQHTGGPFDLTVTGQNTIVAKDILVGEVWVCSGQSNMERQLGPRPPQQPIENWEQEAAGADFPKIRMYIVPHSAAHQPVEDAKGKWLVCTPQNVIQFSAVGFFFARYLHQHINQPVGMLFTSVGGTQIEAWMSAESLSSLPEGKREDVAYQKQLQDYPAQKAEYDANLPALMTKWQADADAAKAAGKPAPGQPKPPRDPSQNYPNRLFNAMVAPLISFPIKGVIWYQGESNGGNGLGYRSLLPAMINDWRTRWNETFPFCIVQIASFNGGDPLIREAQFLTLSKVASTALVVTTDVGDPNDIHPPKKRPMGERLGLAALALAYGGKDEYSGPLYDSATTDGSKMVIHFTHATKLAAKDGTLTGFMIAGDDKKFVPADAVIVGNTVVVSAASVTAPVAVRYSFDHITLGNLINGAGLPASPFRTDVDPDRQY